MIYGSFADAITLPPVYSEVLEDERPIRAWLAAGPGDVALSIASGGDNVFNLLLDEPDELIAIDVSPAQVDYCALKAAALTLPFEQAATVLGLPRSSTSERAAILDQLLQATGLRLSEGPARQAAVEGGLLLVGIFESLVSAVRTEIQQVLAEDIVLSLIRQDDGAARARIWTENEIDQRLLPVFKIFFSEDSLKDVFTPASFHDIFDCSPFPEYLLAVLHRKLVSDSPAGNYFMHRWCLGRYLTRSDVPPYLTAAGHDRLTSLLGRVRWQVSEILPVLAGLPRGQVRCFNLSNILDWCDDEHATLIWREITRVAAAGARVFVRSFLADRGYLREAARLGWQRDVAAESRTALADRVGYYPHYQLWAQA